MLKHIALNFLRGRGLELRRYHPNNSQHSALHTMLRQFQVNLVLDVGANVGQFAEELLETGYTGRIVSFEPLAAAHASLSERAKAHERWSVHPRAAVGAESGHVTMHVSENSVSSSVLQPLARHVDAAPESRNIGVEQVPLIRLDDVAPSYESGAHATLLKIDTQGFEWSVLDGASALLQRVTALQLELSLVPLYEGQRLWRDYVDRLDAIGFALFFAYPAFTDTRTGQTLQWDAMFLRKTDLGLAPHGAQIT